MTDDRERQVSVVVAEMAGREGTEQAYVAEVGGMRALEHSIAFGRTPGDALRAIADRIDQTCAAEGFHYLADDRRE